MLEPTNTKIIVTKPMETAIPDDPEDGLSKEAALQQNAPEAEVRLVVRLFVEEHIVFNGKVEQVKELEREELSRIVSRISWNGPRERSKSPLEADSIETYKNLPDPEIEQKEHIGDDEVLRNDLDKSASQDSEKAGTPDESISQDNSPYTKDSPEKSDDAAVLEVNLREVQIPVDRCDEVVVEESPQTNYLADEVRAQETPDTCKTTELNSPATATVIDLDAINRQNDGAMENTGEESRTISEALKACVDSVEREVQARSEPLDVSSIVIKAESPGPVSKKEHTHPECVQPTPVTADKDKIDKKPLSESVNATQMIDTKGTEEKAPEPNEIQLQNELSKLSRTGDRNDLSVKTVVSRKSSNCLPTRRRNTSDGGSSIKRARRTNSRDGRNLRQILDRSVENASERSLNVVENCEDKSPSDYLSRHNKIFAKWSDNHFYPGTILKPARDRKYVISFFDGAQRSVAETDLIPLMNIKGRQVRVAISKNYCVNAVVHDQRAPVNDQPMFEVEFQQEGLVKKCVPLRDIFLTSEQGTPLISQPIRPDKNPDESMFAGVDLDNIVHVKRSRRLQEMDDDDDEDDEMLETTLNDGSTPSSRRKRQYNIRNTTPRARNTEKTSRSSTLVERRKHSYSELGQTTPISSCSPDNIKTNLQCPNSNAPSEGSNSTGSSNTANVLDLANQDFYFDSAAPHRTKTSLLF